MRYIFNKFTIVVLFFVLAVSGLGIWNSYRLVPYVPVVLALERGNHILRYDDTLMTAAHKERICAVFIQYDEYCTVREGVILIRNYLLCDMDLLQNYTNKANE